MFVLIIILLCIYIFYQISRIFQNLYILVKFTGFLMHVWLRTHLCTAIYTDFTHVQCTGIPYYDYRDCKGQDLCLYLRQAVCIGGGGGLKGGGKLEI